MVLTNQPWWETVFSLNHIGESGQSVAILWSDPFHCQNISTHKTWSSVLLISFTRIASNQTTRCESIPWKSDRIEVGADRDRCSGSSMPEMQTWVFSMSSHILYMYYHVLYWRGARKDCFIMWEWSRVTFFRDILQRTSPCIRKENKRSWFKNSQTLIGVLSWLSVSDSESHKCHEEKS